MRPRVLFSIGAALAVLAAVVGVGALVRTSDATSSAARRTVDSKPVRAVETTTSTTTTAPPPTTTLPPVEPDPPNQMLPDLHGGSIGIGARGPDTQVYEQRLADLRFDVGAVDGSFDQQTQYAVQGFQKLEGLPITSRIDLATSQAMATFKWPLPLQANAEPSRLEVNVTKQYAVLWSNYNVKLITTVSTGAGENYCYVPLTGGSRVCEYADTPSGRYQFNYRYTGWQKSDLGQLFNPVYFNGGIAVHGYPTVPTVPASHGCVRIPMHTAGFFPSLVVTDEPVYVFGGTNGRRPVTRTPLPPTTAPPATTTPPATTAPPVTTAPPATTAVPATAPTAPAAPA
ncbi:MAG: Ykud protein [Actinomycetia bacterium]|nr:Ykud protein [Actinomycetes bacterium]